MKIYALGPYFQSIRSEYTITLRDDYNNTIVKFFNLSYSKVI